MTQPVEMPIPRELYEHLKLTHPEVVEYLRRNRVKRMIVRPAVRVTNCVRLEFPDITLNPTGSRHWYGFDRQIDSDKATVVLHMSLEDFLTSTVHNGRIPCTRAHLDTGERVWLDPKTIHMEDQPDKDCGPHKAERETEVEIADIQAFMLGLRFDDGHRILMDIDEALAWDRLWKRLDYVPVNPVQ